MERERYLDHDLDRIRQDLLRMAGLVEAMIADGALFDADKAAALTDDLIAAQAQHLPRFS